MQTLNDLKAILPRLVAAAQEEYDGWDQDENGDDPELGAGGICQLIADRMSAVLSDAGFEAAYTHSEGVGENHVWVTSVVAEGVITVDIPPHVYELGSGYVWVKIPDVSFSPDDVAVTVIDRNPGNFRYYVDEGYEFDDDLPTP